MPISTIPKDTPLPSLKEDDDLTRGNLEANPLTQPLAIPFNEFIEQKWQPALLLEFVLVYAIALANAQILYRDTVLNGLVKKLDSALLMLTNKDRSAQLYILFFGAQRPFEVAAGILGPQLEKMRSWILLLASSKEPTLKAIGIEIEAAVAAADAAVKAKSDAVSAFHVFETTGEKVQVVAEYNALRKVTYGALGALKHEHPELPNDFPETFFRHEGKRSEDRLSPDELQTKIDALKAQQTALEKKREALLAKMKEDADAKALLEEKQAKLDAKKKEQSALDAEIKQLESDLKKK